MPTVSKLEKRLPSIESVHEITRTDRSRDDQLTAICQLLKNSVPGYDWVGFYIADEDRRELILGPYAGAPTPHVRIPFGSGICGQAAETLETHLVQDVKVEANYLTCSPAVESEIVIPIFKGDRLVGELDVDSHRKARFTETDRQYLERVAEVVSVLF